MTDGTSAVDEATVYRVVVNEEEQHSIWPASMAIPPGWHGRNVSGSKSECLAHIEAVWTDLRPLSLRQAMKRAADQPGEIQPGDVGAVVEQSEEESLPIRLMRGRHPIELRVGSLRSAAALAQQIRTGYVHVRFTDTRGGTELGISIAPEAIAGMIASIPDRDVIRLIGAVVLDDVEANCVADVSLTTLTGSGWLELVVR